MRRGSPPLVLLVALLAGAPGCFWFATKQEGAAMRSDIKDLKARMARQEQSVDEKVAKLDESLDKATKLLARNSADLGAEVQKLTEEIATLRGQVGELQRELADARAAHETIRADAEGRLAAAAARIEALEKKTAAPATPPAPDKDALYGGALRKLEAKQYEDARKDFRSFLGRFPRDERAARAQYLLGESFFREGNPEMAIAELQKVIDSFGDSDQVDDALYRAGEAAESMKWCTDARAYYGVLVQRLPGSPLAKQAKQKLDYLKKKASDKKVCQS